MAMSTYQTFLIKHNAKNFPGKPITHTRIGNTKKGGNVYGGSYHIPDEDLQEFHQLYYDYVFVKGNKEYLTEAQTQEKFYIDLDFRYNWDCVNKLYGTKEIDDVVFASLELIKKYMKVDETEFYVNVFEKKHVRQLPDHSVSKDGMHILFNLKVDRDLQKIIRKNLIELCETKKLWENFKLLNNWDSVFDETITNGTTNCMLLGSIKPPEDDYVFEPYQLTHRTLCKLDLTDNEFSTISQPVNMSFDLFQELSVQNARYVSFESKIQPKQNINQPTINKTASSSSNLNIIKKLVLEIRKFDNDFGYNYPEWSKIGWTIYNETNGSEHGENLFDELSQIVDIGKVEKKYDGITAIKKQYYSTQDKRQKKLGLKWMMDILKQGNPNSELFAEIASMNTKGKVRFATDDNVASDILFEELKDHFKAYKKRLFYLDNYIWIDDADRINDIMLQYILESGIYLGFNEKTGNPIPYAQNVSKALKIRDALYSKIRVKNDDPELYEKFHDENIKGCLCFNDGVLNLKNKTFTLWADIPKNTIFTTTKINYDLGSIENIKNENVMADVKRRLFEPMFGDKMELALKFLARAMGGHNVDKTWATYMGNRNCGKGVLYDLLKSAFGNYVSTFELGNLTYNRKTAGAENVDCSKKLYWLLDLEFVRLAISQEVPSKSSGLVVNGKMLKKITGGGDEIVARRNYDRFDTHFKSDMTPFILGNEDLQCDTNDSNETRLEFSSVVQFKSAEEIKAMQDEGRNELEMKRYRLSDPNIKTTCSTDAWKFAMVGIIMESYTNDKVSIIKDIDTEENTLLGRLNEIFEFTYKETDIMQTKEVYSKIEEYDNKKIKEELKAMNIFDKKQTKGELKMKWCFVGIKIKPPKEIPIATAISSYKNENDECDEY